MNAPHTPNKQRADRTRSARHRSASASTATATMEAACWLDDCMLLISGAITGFLGEASDATLLTAAGRQSLSMQVVSTALGGPMDRGLEEDQDQCWISVVSVRPDDLPDGRLVIQIASSAIAVESAMLSELISDFDVVLRTRFAPLNAEMRARVMHVLVTALCAERDGFHDPLRLSQTLLAARNVLRERLPRSVALPEKTQALHVDALFSIDRTAYYMRGWIRDSDISRSRLTVVAPEGARTEVTGSVFLYARPDIEALFGASIARTPVSLRESMAGFITYFETDAPSYLLDGWIVELRDTIGNGVEAAAPPIVVDDTATRSAILASMIDPNLERESLRIDHLRPALDRLQQRRRAEVRIERVEQYGPPPPSPEVSIVVPLYQRIDFLEHQLAQFVHDPELADADLIYVLDSPELATPLRESAALLHQLYRIPFRVVILSENAGFSGANNFGASLARGRLLILLNSDILPDRPGWVSDMTAFHDATPDIGAVSPKLLYEDNSIQHAGMYFYRDPRSTVWHNEHYYKGLHRSLAAANVTREVPAVTAACLMMDRALYTEVGGLRGVYVQGDYEDSDLCLRLRAEGRGIWYLPTVELYHLEGQSYPSALRAQTTAYNRWLHSHHWHAQIEPLMAEDLPKKDGS